MYIVRRSAVVLGLLLSGPVAWAQTPDHLQCFKIRDSAPKSSYTANLIPGNTAFPTATGCVVSVPAKVLCIDVVKDGVTPPPPGSPGGAAAQTYLCYKTKCPKAQPTATLTDQFGTHMVAVKKMSLLCAPVAAASTTTTTTSTTTSSTMAGCANASQCPGTDTDCQQRTCTAGTCGFTFAPANTPLAVQTAGDCQQLVCDGNGGTTSLVDDSDVPDDGNQCTGDACVSGTAMHTNQPVGFPCSQNGGNLCDGNGSCVQCLTASDCPGSDTECQQRTCTAGTCGFTFAPANTPLAVQTAGDCQQLVCDGSGGTTSLVDDSDVPDDGNQCTGDACVSGTAMHTNQPVGFPCSQNGGTVCDGAGSCVP